jgi:hypothetical protein
MNSLARSIVGAAMTAVAAYYMDPVNGHRRRLMLSDKVSRVTRRVELGTRDARHDVSEQARSLASRTRSAFAPDHLSDKAVSKQVRSAVRQTVSQPESVVFTVDHGHVILRGGLLPHEHQRLLNHVRRQPGVAIITDHLTEQLNGLGSYALDVGPEFRSRTGGWSKAGRVLAGCAGGALLIWGVRERKAVGEFGVTVAEALRRAAEQSFKTAKETVAAAEEGLSDAARSAADKVDDGMEWAESASNEAVEQYGKARRRAADIGGAAH